ncbi:hypothetical protein QSJ19_06645 [Gordonia sp. ABSL11-1]|nr:hypothetical protein [Gordonia sp. ABSL11-1]MDL9945274.1 hypothetical protein [Gordonia sp. ABSL11-1]
MSTPTVPWDNTISVGDWVPGGAGTLDVTAPATGEILAVGDPTDADNVLGPIIDRRQLERVDDIVDQAIDIINASEYGLSVGILTGNAFRAYERARPHPVGRGVHQRSDRRRRGGRALRRHQGVRGRRTFRVVGQPGHLLRPAVGDDAGRHRAVSVLSDGSPGPAPNSPGPLAGSRRRTHPARSPAPGAELTRPARDRATMAIPKGAIPIGSHG